MTKLLDWIRHKPVLDAPPYIDGRTDSTIEEVNEARRQIEETRSSFKREARHEQRRQKRLRAVLLDSGMDYETMNRTGFGRLPKNSRGVGEV